MLRLSGVQAVEIAQRMAPKVKKWEHSTAVVGYIYQSNGTVLDQVVITTFKAHGPSQEKIPWSFPVMVIL